MVIIAMILIITGYSVGGLLLLGGMACGNSYMIIYSIPFICIGIGGNIVLNYKQNTDVRKVKEFLKTIPEDCQHEYYKYGQIVSGFKKKLDGHPVNFEYSYDSDEYNSFSELKDLMAYMKYYNCTPAEKAKAYYTDKKEYWNNYEKICNLSGKTARYNMTEKETDPYGLAGMASGIGGPIMGAATIARIEADNAAIRARNAAREGEIHETIVKSIREENHAKTQSEEVGKLIDAADKIDAISVDTISTFKELQITTKQIDVTKTGAVRVEAVFNSSRDDIDGVVVADIMKNDECCGKAYFVFPIGGLGKGETTLSSICTKTTDPNAEYHVEYEPVKLYKLRGGDQGVGNYNFIPHLDFLF